MNPLFLDSPADVKDLLRLSNLPAGKSGEKILEEALSEAHTSLWAYLGKTRLDELVAITPNSTLTDDDDYLYLIGQAVEVQLTRYHLATRMPMGFRDGTLSFLESYQTEGAFSRNSVEQTEQIRHTWWNDHESGIQRKLDILKEGASAAGAFAASVGLRGVAEDKHVDIKSLVLGPKTYNIEGLLV